MAERSWSLAWNEKAGQFFVRFRKFWVREGESAWGTKRLPRTFRRHQELDAERWVIDWYAKYQQQGGVAPDHGNVVPIRRTIEQLGPKWLQYRHEDRGTALKTYEGYVRVYRNWIRTNERFEHFRIDRLDMDRDFVPEVCLRWVRSLRGKPTTIVRYADILKQLFKDCILHSWVNPTMHNPMDHPLVTKHLAVLRREADKERPTVFLTAEQASDLLTRPSRKVIDYRRIRYLLVLATGLRDAEVQGLTWSDLHLDAPIPFLNVERQLIKSGPKPWTHVRELRDDKSQIGRHPTAVVDDPKKNSKRPMPLIALLTEALRYWWKIGWAQYTRRKPQKDDPVFPAGQRNSHQEYGSFCMCESPELLRKDLERLRLPMHFTDPTTGVEHNMTFHGLRHTFSTLLDLQQVDRRRIDQLLGHGAGKVAEKHYLGKLVAARAPIVAMLPLPTKIQLQGRVIEVADFSDANVVPIIRPGRDEGRRRRR